jgi:outer membrane protein assembly factor BamE (lipoprotein component of BamABCDE complex)
MVVNLVESRRLIGLPHPEVRRLLGSPDTYAEGQKVWFYGSFQFGHTWNPLQPRYSLMVEFDKEGNCSSAMLTD